ncbi:50S ribosomal protein L1 [Gammaproteobacteria bacterium]|nr:50S ribosomal protein L1 [Gammaproteobacteria bacterium]
MTSKRHQESQKNSKPGLHSIGDAVTAVKAQKGTKFDESVDFAIRLGLDVKKTDQSIRLSTVLPCGTGKTKRIAVFAEGQMAQDAKSAGADIVGCQDLFDNIKAGKIDFDVLISHPSHMAMVGKLGPILGPKGLMPNPKVGTVTADLTKSIKEVKSGRVQLRADKAGQVHGSFGRKSFSKQELVKNFEHVMSTIIKHKPDSAKGKYLLSCSISPTMGVGVQVEL